MILSESESGLSPLPRSRTVTVHWQPLSTEATHTAAGSCLYVVVLELPCLGRDPVFKSPVEGTLYTLFPPKS
jgi:hypothetical protein